MSETKLRFSLSREDKVSATWKKLMAHWRAQLETLHRRLEDDMSEADTAALRGRIKEIRSNLRLDLDPPEPN